MRVTARTRVFAILGDPVGHSLSPRMHNAGFDAAGLDAVYIALQTSADHVVPAMDMLVRSGGGGNVTIPFKRAAAHAAATRDARVDALDAANLFGTANGGLHLGNTDVDGVLTALDRLRAPMDGWLVLGTGGSARAVVGAAVERGARVAVRSRDPERATAFATWARSLGVESVPADSCRVVINATPLGLAPTDSYPIDPATLVGVAAVLDLVYAPHGPTAWVRDCNALGIPAIDGRAVLLAQGAASWKLWFPDVDPPLEVMRAAVDGSLV